jgi:hypothetical protein
MANKIVTSIFDAKYKLNIVPEKIIDTNLLYSLENDLEEAKKLLQDLSMANLKRLSITNKNYAERDVRVSKKENYRKLEIDKALNKNSYDDVLLGISNVLSGAVTDLKELHTEINNLGIKNGIPQAEVNKCAKTMMKARNYIDAYKKSMEQIRKTYLNSPGKEEQKLVDIAGKILLAMEDLDSAYIDQSIALVKELFRPFFGDRKTISFDGKTVTLDELVTQSPTDIGFMDL